MSVVLSVVLVLTPGAITRHFAPIHRLRCWLLGLLYYYWQLSLEGPLFKLIGGCAKRCAGVGFLASHCKAPKAFKVTALNCSDLDLAWTPQIAANPFHVEHYILSYREVSLGEEEPWVERVLSDTDLHKKDKEKPKGVGKATRKRLVLSDLPASTSFRLRLCAAGPSGRGPWTPEVRGLTFTKPNEKMGSTGPLAAGAPLAVKEFRWWQSKNEVGFSIPIPEDWTSKDIKVKVTPKDFTMSHTQGKLLAGPLGMKVQADEVDWVLEKGADGKQLSVTLKKEKLMQVWEVFIDAEGHQHIDPALVKLIYEGNSMNELASRDLWD